MDQPTARHNHPEHHISAGIRGWLDSPAADAAIGDCVFVTGWVFSTGARIAALWTDVGGERRPLRAGLRRDDVAAAYPHDAGAIESGFDAYIEFDRTAPPKSLTIYADLDDGRTIRLFTSRLSGGEVAGHL